MELERENIRSLAGVVVEFVADVHQEVVGFADFLKSVVRDEPVIDKSLEIARTGFHAADPEDILVIAKATAGFLHVRLLQENGVRGFLVAGTEIDTAVFEKDGLAFRDAILFESNK